MEYITTQTTSLIAISFLFAFFSILLRGKSGERIRYLSGIVLTVYLISFVSPIIKLAINTEFNPHEDTSTENELSDNQEALIRAMSAQLCKDIKTLIINRFNIPESSFSVSVTVEQLSNKQLSLNSVTVKYYVTEQNTLTDSEASVIAKYISDTVAAPCTLLIETAL